MCPNPSTYDRYTFYRMLAQLGTDSAPAQNQINLNYSNAVATFAFASIHGQPSRKRRPSYQYHLFCKRADEPDTVAAAPVFYHRRRPAAARILDRLVSVWSVQLFVRRIMESPPIIIYQNGLGNFITNDPTGVGLVNVPYFGLTNQVPSFGITNIPVLANGQFVYTPAVQRVLQLAANIYDATTNNRFFMARIIRRCSVRFFTKLFLGW